MKVFTLSSLCALILALTSCSKDESKNPPPPPKTTPVTLEGRSVTDVLQLKYNKAQLKCDLLIQKNSPGNPLTQTDSVVWPLNSQSAFPVSLSLKAQIEQHQLTVEVRINSLEIANNLTVQNAENSATHKLKFTPVLSLSYQSEIATQLATGPVFEHESSNLQMVNEKIGNYLFKSILRPENSQGLEILDQLYCVIETDIKPDYQDQFETQSKP